MADEIDAGRIVAEIVLETKQAQRAAEEIQEEFEKLDKKKVSPMIIVDTSQAKDGVDELNSELDNASGKSVTPVINIDTKPAVDAIKDTEQMIDKINTAEIKPKFDYETLSYIKGSLEEMGITGQEMVDMLNAGFGNLTEVKKYRVALEEIALKIDECRTKMQALNVGDNIDSGAVENYSDALTQLEEQYDKILAKLDAYVAKTVATVQRTKNIENEINELSGLNTPKVVDNGTMLQTQSYEDTLIYIREVLEKLKITGKQADDIISACFQDVSSLRKYQNELEVVAGKLDTERKKYQELSAARDRAEKRGDYSAVDKITSAMDDQVNKIKTLEARFDSVYEKQDNAVKKTVASYQKQSSAAQNAQVKQDKLNEALDNKQAGKNFAGGVSLATTSLRTFNSIAPDTVDGIGEIITQINAAKQAMTAGTSAPLAWGTAIIAGIGIVASLVVNEIQKVQQAEEEARQTAAEAASEYETNKNELKDLSEQLVSLRSKLDNVNLSRQEEIETKNQLYQLQDELIKKYGLESDAIDTVTGSIKEQNGAIKELEKAEARRFLLKSANEYEKYKSEMESKQTYTIYTKYGGVLGGDHGLNDEIKAELQNNPYIQFRESNGGHGRASLSISLNVDGKEVKAEIDKVYESMYNLQKKYISNGDTKSAEMVKNFISQLSQANQNYINDAYEQRLETYNQCLEAEKILNGTAEDTEKTQKSLSETINDTMSESISKVEEYSNAMSDLSSAYQTISSGEKLSADNLSQLMEKYPELAEYVNQTGDLTLANGEKIKEAYENQKKALISTLEEEKKALESLQKPSANLIDSTKQVKNLNNVSVKFDNTQINLRNRLDEINAELAIYNSGLTKLNENSASVDWASIAGEVKNLASAYQTLNEGKQLDVDTMIQLIDKYPEVATAMANEGKLGKEQANVFKTLFEAKKQDYILTQQTAIDNLKAKATETEGVIANIRSQIIAYQALGSVVGIVGMTATAQLAGLNALLSKNESDYNSYINEIDQIQARINAVKNIDIDTYGKGGSGSSGSDRNEALSNELKQLEHKKAIGQLTSKQEYDWLVRINNRYSKNADEQMDMEKRLYNAKKQMQADEEAANTKALQAAYKGIENKKSLGKMTSQQELKQLEQIRQKYKMTADERMELEIKIYNLKKSLKDEEISSINTLADAVTEALKEKYEEQRKIEEDRINDSIESWQKWEDKTVEAIQGEIDALDELADKQESENKRQEYENKRQQTELQLAYEKDDYNRQQLQKELNRLDKEEAERLAEEQREAQKKLLQQRIEAVKGQSQATQERLKDELNAVGEKYDKLTDTFSLKAQAQKFIANNTQKDIVNLIKSYASDYEIAGNTVGDALYNGMKAKMDNIEAYVDGIFSKIEAYQRQIANTANVAADQFWASQNAAQTSQQPASKSVTVQQTVNFNQPVESPVETRRQLDKTNQALAQQISSGI